MYIRKSCLANCNENLSYLQVVILTYVCISFLSAVNEQMNSTGPMPHPTIRFFASKSET